MRVGMYEQGEVIPVRDDYGEGHELYYVRGHMHPDDADRVLLAYFGERLWHRPQIAWARWSMESTPDGPGLALVDYDQPGAGRFTIMRADPLRHDRMGGT